MFFKPVCIHVLGLNIATAREEKMPSRKKTATTMEGLASHVAGSRNHHSVVTGSDSTVPQLKQTNKKQQVSDKGAKSLKLNATTRTVATFVPHHNARRSCRQGQEAIRPRPSPQFNPRPRGGAPGEATGKVKLQVSSLVIMGNVILEGPVDEVGRLYGQLASLQPQQMLMDHDQDQKLL